MMQKLHLWKKDTLQKVYLYKVKINIKFVKQTVSSNNNNNSNEFRHFSSCLMYK